MNSKLILLVFVFSLFFFSFSEKKEINKDENSLPNYVNSLVQSTDYLKLRINSPMKLGEYTSNKTDKASLIKSASKDIIFIPNKGQIIDTEGKLRPDIFYKAELNGVDLYLTNKGMSFVFHKYEDIPNNLAAGNKEMDGIHDPFKDEPVRDREIIMYRMDLDIVGMNTNFKTLNEEQATEYFNYYYAHCPDGITNVYGYRKVIFKDVYENIDLVYHSNEEGMKYDFIVKPSGDVSDIKLKYNYVDEVYITEEGKIKALNPFGEVETNGLYTYQSNGKVIESNYQKDTDGTISIITKDYDRTKELIIDPYIGATYYGGNNDDIGQSITADGNDNIFVTGGTRSTNFPVQNPGGGAYFQGTFAGGSFDVFILKFNSSGVRQWATYYGGSVGGLGWDFAYSISIGENNNVLVTGFTECQDFPVFNPGGGVYFQGSHAGGYEDIFILKFSSNGVRQWATYYGGNDIEKGHTIVTDGNNNILVTGETESFNFPVYNPGGGTFYKGTKSDSSDVFILKFNSIGVRQWATYYGGDGWDHGLSITTDVPNNILLTGWTSSLNFPVQNLGGGAYFQSNFAGGWFDAFILKFDSSGVRQWSTYYGGNEYDVGNSITTDGTNNIFITGGSSGGNFPLQNPGSGAYYQDTFAGATDAFILKFNSSGVRQWSTFYGGNNPEQGSSINSDENGNIFITGETKSTNFPVLNPGGGAYFQGSYAGGSMSGDVFMLKFNSSNVRQWATYYGGSGSDLSRSITTDGSNNIYVTGGTESTNFPVFNPGGAAYYQGANAGQNDAFILGFTPSGVIGVNAISTSIPDGYELYQNYPNPFNPTTSIKFDIPKSSHVKLIVYDILGKEITILVNEKLDAGSYEIEWSALSGGSVYPSGVYYYRLEVGDPESSSGQVFVSVKKMVLVK